MRESRHLAQGEHKAQGGRIRSTAVRGGVNCYLLSLASKYRERRSIGILFFGGRLTGACERRHSTPSIFFFPFQDRGGEPCESLILRPFEPEIGVLPMMCCSGPRRETAQLNIAASFLLRGPRQRALLEG